MTTKSTIPLGARLASTGQDYNKGYEPADYKHCTTEHLQSLSAPREFEERVTHWAPRRLGHPV